MIYFKNLQSHCFHFYHLSLPMKELTILSKILKTNIKIKKTNIIYNNKTFNNLTQPINNYPFFNYNTNITINIPIIYKLNVNITNHNIIFLLSDSFDPKHEFICGIQKLENILYILINRETIKKYKILNFLYELTRNRNKIETVYTSDIVDTSITFEEFMMWKNNKREKYVCTSKDGTGKEYFKNKINEV